MLQESAFAFFLLWKEVGEARHSRAEPLSVGFLARVLGGTDVHVHACLSVKAVDTGDTISQDPPTKAPLMLP